MGEITITEEAIALLRRLEGDLQQTYNEIIGDTNSLLDVYEENKSGLGFHSDSIAQLIEQLRTAAKINEPLKRLARKLRFSANNRQKYLQNDFPIGSEQPRQEQSLQAYTAGVFGRMYESGYRAMRKPIANGTWQGNMFIPDAAFKPTKFNPKGRTFGEIIQHLETNYGISYTGTPFVEGYADFSQIAIAQIDLSEIMHMHQESSETDIFGSDDSEIFNSRSRNFLYADEIAARKQISIHGLTPGYSAADLTQWRENNHFTWDESYLNGYLLVPAEIHNNISHTGLVGISTNSLKAEQNITQRLASHRDAADDF